MTTPLVAPEQQQVRPSPARFLAMIAPKLEATEAVFRRHLCSQVPFIQNAGEYLADGGGKRMRPALLLLVSRLLGHDSDEEVTYAAVVEYIHTATLVHDDVIDHAALRRGRASANELWGNSLTVLLGDWIYTTAMKTALTHDNLQVVRSLCDATLRMVEGELLALQRLRRVDLTVDEYFTIIERKTAHLFGAACTIPTLIHPQRPDAEPDLRRYGTNLGTCFQLVDDLLDFTASEQELGKPVLSDLKEGRLTLPLILALPRVEEADRTLVSNVLEDGGFGRTSREEILGIVEREGTVHEVREMADQYADRATQVLQSFPAGDARDALELAPRFVLDRRS